MMDECAQNEVNRRNTDTIREKIKEQDILIREQQIRIDGLLSLVSTLDQRFNQLESRLNIERAKSFGTGASIRD